MEKCPSFWCNFAERLEAECAELPSSSWIFHQTWEKCVVCWRQIKMGKLAKLLRQLGFSWIDREVGSTHLTATSCYPHTLAGNCVTWELRHCYMLRLPIWALIDSVPESSGWNVPVFVWREPEEAEGGWGDWRGRGWEDCAGESGEQLLCQPKFKKLLYWWAFFHCTKHIFIKFQT